MKASFASVPVLVGLTTLLVLATAAHADPVKCQRSILKDSGKFAQAKIKVLKKCEEAKVRGKLPPATVCLSDIKTATAISKAESQMRVGIAKSCGGPDKNCGTTGGNDSLVSIGWNLGNCPDFESMGCTNALNNCNDIADCLFCINERAIDQAMNLYYGSLNPSLSDKQLNRCQVAIGKATAAFFAAKTRALGKCWDARHNGKHAFPCPVPGDGKAQAAIAKAEAKKIAAICRACGGGDRGCDQTVSGPNGTTVPGTGGSDDLTPTAIGFPANCPSVTVPGGPACGGPITDLASLVACVDCVTEFKVDCELALAVPTFQPYPPECNPGGGGVVIQRGDDGWLSPESGGSFSDFSGAPIPSGFFGPNSDPFSGILALRGQPLHTRPLNALGSLDSIVRRPVNSVPLTVGGPSTTIPIEIVALSLVSAQPLTVTYNGGMTPELWDVKAALSTIPQTQGTMTLQRTGPDGGTYDSTLPVLPKFIFTRQSDKAVRILDCGGGGCGGPIVFQSTGSFWALVGGPGAYDPAQNGIDPVPAGVGVDGDSNGTDELTTIGSSNFRPGVKIQSPPECVMTVEATLLAQHGIGAGCTDHYKLYAASGPDGPIVDLEDEDFNIQGNIDLGSVNFFMNPVKKECPSMGCDTAIIGHPKAHLTGYPVTGTFGQNIEMEDQFGTTVLNVGNPSFLAVPSEKAIGPLPVTPDDLPIDHYKCYDATAAALNKTAMLTDQFDVGPATVTLLNPIFFCNPVVKNGEGVINPKWHLTCYQFTPTPPFSQAVNVRNQFGTSVVTIMQSQALCVPSRKPPSVCGGRKCVGGPNNGISCLVNSNCPGGSCQTPPGPAGGAPSKPNGCLDDTLSPNPDDTCAPDPNTPSPNDGTCPNGPTDTFCSPTETFRGCVVNVDCPFAGDTCTGSKLRDCFSDGNIGDSVSATGQADVPAGHQFDPTLASLFCVGPTSSAALNAAAGLPGLARLELQGHATDNGTVGTCPTSFTFEGTSTNGVLDIGWTGMWHDMPVISDALVTYAVSGCANPSPPCGVCDYTGPIANAAVVGNIDSQRCSCDPASSCTSDLDCPGNCACVFYSGSYLPVSGGGISACIGSHFEGSVSGTINVDTGATAGTALLKSDIYFGVSLASPCPKCVGDSMPNEASTLGTCSAGLHANAPCDANAVSPQAGFGPTSLDCPPLVATRVASLAMSLPNTTGTSTVTLTADSPKCVGAPNYKCFCGICDNSVGDPCDANAQCGQ